MSPKYEMLIKVAFPVYLVLAAKLSGFGLLVKYDSDISFLILTRDLVWYFLQRSVLSQKLQ